MNFLAGLLLTWMPNEATAYAGLVVLMQQQGLRDLYKFDLARLQVSITPPLGLTCTGFARGGLLACVFASTLQHIVSAHQVCSKAWLECLIDPCCLSMCLQRLFHYEYAPCVPGASAATSTSVITDWQQLH